MNTKTFEAIEKLKEVELELHRLKNALEMANKALDAQPAQQKPLGFMNAGNILEMQQKSLPYAYVYPVKSTGVSVAVYTSSQPAPVQQEPVAWMTQARNFVHLMEFTEAEAKIYGWKAVYTTPQPAQQELVGYVYSESGVKNAAIQRDVPNGTPLYTSPQPAQRKALTDEQIKGIYEDCDAPTGGQFTLAFARAIEAAHGIKENT